MKQLFIIGILILSTQMAFAKSAESVYSALGISNQPTQTENQPLPAREAFKLHSEINKHSVTLNWDIFGDYYLYRNNFTFTLKNVEQAKIGQINFPATKTINDPLFGKVKIYQKHLQIIVHITGKITKTAQLMVSWQGCTGNLCYPPQHKKIELGNTNLESSPLISQTKPTDHIESINTSDNLTNVLNSSHYLWTLLILFGIGILLSFTPCVLPMIPVLSGIIMGQKDRSWLSCLTLAISYILGMAITYAIFGLIISNIGVSFQSTLQQPISIMAFALVFVILSLSMFGLYELRLTISWHNGLQKRMSSGGNIPYVFLMGVFSTLILSPCTSAPLIGILGYVAQSGNAIFGGIALFTMAIGMGIPLLIISVGAGKLLPKTGNWMLEVKRFFGVVLLLVAIYLLYRIWPIQLIMFLTGGVLLVYSMFIGALRKQFKTAWDRISKAVGLIIALYAIALMLGALIGNNSFFFPLSNTNDIQHKKANDKFIEINSLEQLQTQLTQAKQLQQPVLIDFYARWCIECYRMSHEVFPNPAIQTALKNYKLLKVNLTKDSAKAKAISKYYTIMGLPTLILISGNNKTKSRLSGFQSVNNLLNAIKHAD